MRFVDIHSHLIPDLDDGSTSLFETIEMLRQAYDEGTRVMAATPHTFLPPYDNSHPLVVHDAYAEMVKRLNRLGRNGEHPFLTEMALYLGAENFVSTEFLKALERREIFTLNGGRYVLVEFPPFISYEAVEPTVERIREVDLIPVLAHCERYAFFQRKIERLDELRKQGCVVQVNAVSIAAGTDYLQGRVAWSFARNGLIDVVASDGHDAHDRPPGLEEACERLSEEFPEESVHAWMWENPARILANRELVSRA